MIKWLIWNIWTPMSSVLKKADKLNLSLSRPNGRNMGCFVSCWEKPIPHNPVLGYVVLEKHYCAIIMGVIASQITSLMIVYSTVYSDADQRKHQSSASLAFVRGIHQGPVNSPHKRPVTRKIFSFDDVIMNWPCYKGTSKYMYYKPDT